MATLRTFQCLVALVEHGSVSAAAASLDLSIPALSHQITSLEKELGAPVAERQRRGVRITAVGRATVEEARVALLAADRAVKVGRRVGGDSGGDLLRIACDETLTASLIAPILRQWRIQRPSVELDLTEFDDSAAATAMVDDDLTDVAIGARPTRTTGQVITLGDEDIVVVTRMGHPLGDRPDVRMCELGGERFVHYDPANAMAATIDRHAALHEVALHPVVRAHGPNMAAQLAIAGLGVTIVPVSAFRYCDGGVARPLRPALTRELVAVIPEAPGMLAFEFVADARQRGVPICQVCA